MGVKGCWGKGSDMGGTKLSGRRWIPATLVGAGLVAVLAMTGCTTTGAGTATSVGGGLVEQPEPAKITVSPAAGAKDVGPGGPIAVSVADGTLEKVTLTNPDGKQVKGELAADKKSWKLGEDLGYAKTYTWSGSALGADGKSVPLSGSFTTVKPKSQIKASLNTGDGQTYGVAMPIALTFDAPVKDRAAVQKALTVETSVDTEGAWAWLSDRSAHWRPKEYWKPGTKVTVKADTYGIAFGNGAYGRNDVTSTFTIGRYQVVQGNTQTHRMVVKTEAGQTHDFPASFGLESDPGRVTKSGTHVVMSKHASYGMTNPKYNYENVVVPWAVRISNNGEFIHGYAPSIWAQGKQNVSHGCINLAPANAKLYFETVLPGDPVEIIGSTQQLGAQDGDYYDWALSWDKWQALSAEAP
ncbi:Lipoprotein-anchoring transpeptidase ErfK/SrfK [Actinokineospora alba]|uniref:Lipoprotein-anchoring transpeptidase ErfK/SrfK n=2 Tax=Actinokineospora alba TaxID=504798 RepID=A0A1H0PIM6_9PSEU|nr:lipoprotein-anchoring transpeptidase ErfK/SrfK [Actinokineospora alba]SDI64771.1 Lipoprotein-anchoring transpeptidase ErfK/SrfK [Actinokineospora alba]SDP04529.1 Lipoprotein-anchoring transpeptidase ErfK/SrfK [Actinokineospora alba]